MLYNTHIAVTYAVTLPFLVSTGSLSVGNIIAVGIGSVLPDIDHPKSFIGNRTRGLSDSVGTIFGHRGLAHSLAGVIFFLFAIRFLLTSFQLPLVWADWLIVGYMAHLIEDSFSKAGVAWLQPVYNRRMQFGFKLIYYRTGKVSEKLLYITACLGLFYQVLRLFF